MKIHRTSKNDFRAIILIYICIFISLTSACGGGGSGSGSGSSNSSDNLNASVYQVDFTPTTVGHNQEYIIGVSNEGNTNVTINSVGKDDPLDEPFSIIVDQCSNTTLSPSESCTVTIGFAPTDQGTYDDTFDILDENGKTVGTIGVSGDANAYNVSINQVDKSLCSDIRLLMTVTDINDNPVIGLPQNKFKIYEDGVLQTIESFSNTTTPISIVLIMDYSNSIQPYIEDVEQAAKGLIYQLDLNNNTDEVAVMKFAANTTLVQPFTDNSDDLINAIDKPFTGTLDKTLFFDSTYQAIDLLASNAINERRAVIVITDGVDEGSVNYNLMEAIEHANEKGIPVFTVGLGNFFAFTLQSLADETGGQYFEAPTSSDLEAIYLKIAEILSNQYVIVYQSPSFGGSTITIDAAIDNNGMQGEDTKSVDSCQ